MRNWITAGGTALVSTDGDAATDNIVWRDDTGAAVATARPLGKGRVLRFTHPLDAGALPLLLDADFPRQLAALLGDTPQMPSRVAARDLRPTTGAPAWPQPARDLQPWLAVLIAALFIAERWLATRRTRAPAP